MTDNEARRFLEDAPVAHVAVLVQGAPYVSPMSFVVDGNRVLFRTMPGKRLTALESDPSVSIEVSNFDEDSGDWVSVIVSGEAELIDDDSTRQVVMGKLFEKYREVLGSPLSRGGLQPLASMPCVVSVEIDEISGMRSSGLFSPRTRPGRV